MIGFKISRHTLQARWAYCEIISPRFGKNYTLIRGAESIVKKAQAGIPFGELHQTEVDQLVGMLSTARPNSFADNLKLPLGGDFFECVEWATADLYNARTIPVFGEVEFATFINAPPRLDEHGTPSWSDPRVAASSISTTQPYVQGEPIITIRKSGCPMILEGYWRSIQFAKLAKSEDRLLVWLPVRELIEA